MDIRDVNKDPCMADWLQRYRYMVRFFQMLLRCDTEEQMKRIKIPHRDRLWRLICSVRQKGLIETDLATVEYGDSEHPTFRRVEGKHRLLYRVARGLPALARYEPANVRYTSELVKQIPRRRPKKEPIHASRS